MDTAHHLKLKLQHTQPLITRELLVPSNLRLDRLHDVLQIVMGWEDGHLHEFNNGLRGPGERRFGPPEDALNGLMPGPSDESKATLADLAPTKGDSFVYWYDFGDDWIHQIKVHAVITPEPDAALPVCLKAIGAGPPEDCGGPWGYAEMMEVLGDPKHEEYEAMREWVDDDWDPQRYDIDGVNQMLARLAASWKRAPRKPRRKAR